MRKTTLVAVAILTTVSSAAFAQAASSNSGSASTPATTATSQNGTNIRQQLTNNLQQSGFTNIKVLPDSFLVQATDKSGNPVTMFLGPHSSTEVTTVGSNSQPSNPSNAGMHSGGMFTSVPANDE